MTDVHEMTNYEIYMEICSTRTCGEECPLTNIIGSCKDFPRKVLLDAYFSIFGSSTENKTVNITDKEWEDLVRT